MKRMNKSSRRNLSWTGIVLLGLVLLLAACSGGDGNTASKEPAATNGDAPVVNQQADGSPTSKEGEQAGGEVNIMFDFNVDTRGMSLTDNPYVDYIEEQTGVRVKMESPGSAGYMDRLNILMASGDYPDAFMITHSNITTLQRYMNDEMLTDLTPYLDHYPNLKNQIQDDSWISVRKDGGVYAVPYERHDAFNQVVYVNKVWLDNLGLEIPETLDDYYEVMRAFTFDDPDQNGQDDTFGLLALDGHLYGGKMFRAAFDAERFQYVNGELLPSELTENYREYLRFMNRLHEDKLIDPEWPTTTGAIFRQKVATGKYGVFNNFWHFAGSVEIPEEVMSQYVVLKLPLSPDGNDSKFTYNTNNRHYIAIPEGAPNIEQLLTVMDWAVSEEGTKYHYMGIPEVHWTEQNGEYVRGEEEKAALHWSFSMVKHGQLSEDVQKYMKIDTSPDVIAHLNLATEIGQLDPISAALPFFPELSSYNLTGIVDEFAANAMFGNVDLDAGWDAYLEKYRASGGSKAIELYTRWYDEEGHKLVQ